MNKWHSVCIKSLLERLTDICCSIKMLILLTPSTRMKGLSRSRVGEQEKGYTWKPRAIV